MSEAGFDWIRWMEVGAPCGDYLLYFMVVEFEVQKDYICGKKKKKEITLKGISIFMRNRNKKWLTQGG